jgi:transposase InsO family protein
MENRRIFRLEKMCKIMEVSRSGYHKYVNRKMSNLRRQNIEITELIKRIYESKRGRYGSPRIHFELRHDGMKINKKRVARLMRVNGIKAVTKRKFKATTDSNHKKAIADNLVNQHFQVNEANKIWVSDITYIRTKEGWLYLVVIIDLYSRMVVGWSISESLNRVFLIKAIKQALANRNPEDGLIFHSDRGSQYASDEVRALLKSRNIRQSMSSKGNCYDNAVAESFFHSLKMELVFQKTFSSRKEAKNCIFEYIEIFYNRQRRHSTLDYLTPIEFENSRLKLVA